MEAVLQKYENFVKSGMCRPLTVDCYTGDGHSRYEKNKTVEYNHYIPGNTTFQHGLSYQEAWSLIQRLKRIGFCS